MPSPATNPGPNPKYEWFINGEQQDIDHFTFKSSTLQDGDTVSALLISDAECVENPLASSNLVVITVDPIPEINDLWITTIPDLGIPVVLVVCCPGDNTSYEYTWYKNNEVIPGETGQYYYAPGGITEGVAYKAMVTNNVQCKVYTDVFVYSSNKDLFIDESEMFTIFPNPTSGQFTLELNDAGIPAGTSSVTAKLSINYN